MGLDAGDAGHVGSLRPLIHRTWAAMVARLNELEDSRLEEFLFGVERPSGHDISKKFSTNNGAAIPPNLIAIANTESNSQYQRYCKLHEIEPHPARYPAELPEYFIRMLTERGDLVVDPFAGSCVTGEVAERLGRRWVCIDNVSEYLRGGRGRFSRDDVAEDDDTLVTQKDDFYSDDGHFFRMWRPGLLWNG